MRIFISLRKATLTYILLALVFFCGETRQHRQAGTFCVVRHSWASFSDAQNLVVFKIEESSFFVQKREEIFGKNFSCSENTVMASEENIKVAVRLRPFLQNIKEEADGKVKRIVQMDEISSTVSVVNPSNPADIHKFTFDSILWSFDGYSEQADGYLSSDNKMVSEEMYCDQKQVYEEVGKEIIQNLWNGHNSAVFTCGESKSGKSWSLIGTAANRGIVLQTLTDLFKTVREKEKSFQQNGSSLEIRLSMAEIYNERVKDLLPVATSSGNSSKFKSTIKIREHSKKGFYIEGLRNVLVLNHDDAQQRLEEGLLNRAIYLTNCNGTSENSMTIISITLVQKIRNHRGDEVTRSATLEIFDLPACEFEGQTMQIQSEDGCNEDEFSVKESNVRRNGMHNFSRCIDALLEASIGRQQDQIPFYGHALTKLLRNALNGNCKTWMFVAISPSDASYSYSLTLYILRLAEKVRMLTTRSVVNEEVTSKLIRELKGENEKLKKLISLGDFETRDYSYLFEQGNPLGPSERDSLKKRITEEMKAQIRENEKEVRNLQQPLEERLKPFKVEKNDLSKKLENDKKNKCHIFNLNSDSQINSKIVHILPLGTVDFGHVQNNGNGKGKENSHFIPFCGPGIREHHGTFSFNTKDGKISIKPAGPTCRILVNETPIQFDTVLAHNDRIVLGGNQIWIYQNPKETWLEKYAFAYKLHYEYIVEELALKSEQYQAFTQNNDSLSESLQHQLITLIPRLEDVKHIIEDLNQNLTFQPLVVQPIELLLKESNSTSNNSKASYSDTTEYEDIGKPTLLLKVQNTVDGTFSYLSVDTFFSRVEILKDLYVQFLEDGDAPLKEIDAFKESPDMDVPLGYSIICLKPLAYCINIENSAVPILDYINFRQIGNVHLSLHFCDENGDKINDTEVFVESADELLDDNLTIVLSIKEIHGNIILQFKDIYCKYKFLDEENDVTKYLDLKVPNCMGVSSKHERRFVIEPVTDNTLNLILTQYLVLRFYGKQRGHKLLNLMENGSGSLKPYDRGRFHNPVEMENTMAQLKIKEKAEQRHQQRLNALKALIDQSESLGEEAIPLNVVRSLFEAKNKRFVDQNLEEHKEFLTALPEEPPPKQLPPELKALKRFSEVCCIC